MTRADGKVVKLLEIVGATEIAKPGKPVVVIAVFGNSYCTDGPVYEF